MTDERCCITCYFYSYVAAGAGQCENEGSPKYGKPVDESEKCRKWAEDSDD